jgi:hypothetical protein
MKPEKSSLENIRKLIDENNIEKAMEILNHSADKSIWFQNARAVCLMRMNLPEKAVKILTPIVYPGNCVAVDSHVPDKIKLNLATAMLLAGNIGGAMILVEENSQDCPSREKLKAIIKKWKQSQSLWTRLTLFLGALPYDKPVSVEGPLGEL